MVMARGVGVYGKWPTYGDFVSRNLGADFVRAWDEWLSQFILASKAQLGSDWLAIYLTSPIWRFALSTGVIDDDTYAGLMLPSVDRVGRYFPLTAVKTLPAGTNPVEGLLFQSDWFEQAEQALLAALAGEVEADELVRAVSRESKEQRGGYRATEEHGQPGAMVFDIPSVDRAHVEALLPALASAGLGARSSGFSLWMTNGSDHVRPVMLSCSGLPPMSGVASMLDGQWGQRNWKSPFSRQVDA